MLPKKLWHDHLELKAQIRYCATLMRLADCHIAHLSFGAHCDSNSRIADFTERPPNAKDEPHVCLAQAVRKHGM